MEITKNCVVTFHYSLYEMDGTELETSRHGDPTLYLHGSHNILPALEKEFAGKSAGDSFRVELKPELAYGLRDESKKARIPAKYLKHEGKLRPGKVVRFRDDHGVQQATVLKVGKFSVDIDTNHPLAGMRLIFDISIEDVRQASDEELAHGHAHGVGGHQH